MIEVVEETLPLLALITYVPGCSATKLPSGSMLAPLPLTAQRVAKLPAGEPLAVKRMTSPVRAVAEFDSIEILRNVFFTTLIAVLPVAVPDVALMFAFPGATPVTTPAELTVAIAGESDA